MYTEVSMRKLILATASVLALGIGGAALDHAANADSTVPNAGWNMPPVPGTSQDLQTAANLSKKDDFRQAQLEPKYGALQRVARRCVGLGD